jgi:nucleoside-diphosphate-sugar epimerase
MPVILIAGCGDIGGCLGQQLARVGWTVHGLRRNVSALPAGIRPVAGDLCSPACPADWPSGAIDYLVYSAAADSSDEDGYRLAYVQGLHHVLGWLAAHGQRPRRLLFVSSSSVYAQADGQWVDESSPAEADGYGGRILLEAEQLALGCGVPASVVRLTGIYGPGREWLLRQVHQGYRVAGEPALYTNRIHRDDAAGLLAFLLLAERRGVGLDVLYLGVDDTPTPLHEVMGWLRERLGVEHGAEETATRRAGSKRCSNARARALGWVPRYPSYREGYGELLADG